MDTTIALFQGLHVSDNIHIEDDLPTMDQVREKCGYLIEPAPMPNLDQWKWELYEMGGKVYASGLADDYEQAEWAICEAFQRLTNQDTAIIEKGQ
jgi:hypothetical protein